MSNEIKAMICGLYEFLESCPFDSLSQARLMGLIKRIGILEEDSSTKVVPISLIDAFIACYHCFDSTAVLPWLRSFKEKLLALQRQFESESKL